MTNLHLQEAKNFSLKTTLLAAMISLAGCGGGGSDGYYGGTTPENPTTGGSPETPAINGVNISAIELIDVNNAATQVVTASGANAKVKVTDALGKGISGALVTFSGSGVAFGTSNGAVLTNADGEASISIKPLNLTDTGAYQLSAAVEYNGKSANTAAYNFSLQAANIVLANMAPATKNLESGASTNITLKTQDADSKVNQNNVSVNFTATCGTFDNAVVVSANQGDVTTTYKAIDAAGKLCEGEQTITATGSNTSSTQSVKVNIASITANSLIYTTAESVNMATKNSGSASSGQIEFTVFSNGVPAANQDVDISLERGPIDLSFITQGNRQAKVVKSDSAGKVSVNLYPGSLPGPVEIKAVLSSNSNVFVLSKNVSVATGRAYQSGFSISASKNSLSGDMDGDTATVTARLVDRVGNPVPDNTVVSFVSEGGSITPNCATVGGVCSVTLTTQNPRPSDNRVSVIAYVEGDKAYTDVNGDNMYTVGVDTLVSNIGDFFRDDNENNAYDSVSGEFNYKRGANGAACTSSSMNQPNISGTCNNELDAVLRKQQIFAFAQSSPTFVGLSGINPSMTVISSNSFTFQVFGNSERKVPMPSGTSVAVAVKDNTDFKPIAALIPSTTDATRKIITVSNAEPNSIASVKINNIIYPVNIDLIGTGTLEVSSTVSGDPTVEYENQTCEAELFSGFETVPDIINLLTPSAFASTSNSIVQYSVRLKKCAVGDDIRITVNAPKQKTTISITR